METKNRRDYTEVISDSRCPVSAILSLSRVSRDVRRTAFSQKEENIYLLTIGGGGERIFLALGKIAKDDRATPRANVEK